MNKIILDTDPGIDDAVAIIVLLKNCSEHVELILSSYGNISIDKTTQNALTMLSLLNMDITCIRGTAMPDNDKYEEAGHIHGADGLGGLKIDTPKAEAIAGDYLQLIYDAIIKADKVDYITLGPLTNLALLMKRFPDVVEHIETVVSMGGGISLGNVTKYAEFNIYCDAESANYVFENIKKLVLVPLNTTNEVAFDMPKIQQIGKKNTPISLAMEKILTQNYISCMQYDGLGSTMHDATAVLYYLYPEYFETKKCGITVDCGEHYGETSILPNKDNITLTLKAESDILLEKITAAIT